MLEFVNDQQFNSLTLIKVRVLIRGNPSRVVAKLAKLAKGFFKSEKGSEDQEIIRKVRISTYVNS